MHLSPFTVYLVMQADSICTVLILATVVLFVCQAITLIGYSVNNSYECFEQQAKSWLKVAKKITAPLILTAIVTSLAPNTKTLATSIIAPSIVNSDVIQKDVPELYQLALGKIKDSLATPEKK